MKMNLNDNVKVKLTAQGHKILEENHKIKDTAFPMLFPPYRPPAVDKDGWTTYQLWNLMQDFGPFLYNGCVVPFETEIEICPMK